mgnify:CR=1 FL=1
MAAGKVRSAKKRRFIHNTIVHVVLAILALIWVFPILWVILTSFRAEKGSYVSTFFPQSFTLDNYGETVYRHLHSELSTDVCEYLVHRGVFLYSFHILCAGGILLPFQAKIQVAEALYEHGDDPGTVSRIHVHGCRLLYLKGNRTDRRESDQSGADFVLFRRRGAWIPDREGFFDTIPIAVDEAALLDGCTRWQIFSRITLPLSKPIIIYTVLTSFMAPWLDFIFAK